MYKSDMYYQKYIKYKTKYSQYQNSGGNNNEKKSIFDIVDFINTQSFSTIKEKLLPNMNNQKYCDQILGKGMMGSVFVPNINAKAKVHVSNNKKIKVPIAIKVSNEKGDIDIREINDKLYIYGYKDITLEAIILAYINKLWHKKLSPHLPFMIGYSCCDKYPDNSIHVNRIITEKQGLKKIIKQDIMGFNENPIWHPPRNNRNYSVFESPLGTLHDLLKYMILNKKEDMVTLPNEQTCNIVELINYLVISYIHTNGLLNKNNITPHDMHLFNVFVHWLNKSSYLDDEYIGDLEFIYYKLGNKYIKIKTFGLLLKIGDVGGFIINATDKITILGQAVDLEKNVGLIEVLTKNSFSVYWFLDGVARMLPFVIYEKTILCKILSQYPYNELTYLSLPDYKLIEDYKTSDELLESFSEYFVDKVKKDEKYFIVD